ncbi:MAG TPA: glycerate kinase [Mariprofundaceae bacterium]|nr:glycerate kinase [Mariprofundaceae bacterium]
MNYLIAPDSFKGSLTSQQAAEAIRQGILSSSPDAGIRMMPLADGGEGTLDVLEQALQAGTVRKRICSVTLTNGNQAFENKAEYSIYEDKEFMDQGQDVACIESARLIGLNLPAMRAVNVMRRGSGALGQCILHARNEGVRRFIIGLGGTATNDGGLGMLIELGMHAFDEHGEAVTADLAGLLQIDSIDMNKLIAEFRDTDLTVLTDVQSQLTGTSGATRMFGSQKGISQEHLASVDRAMAAFADQCEQAVGQKKRDMPGSGAAGGLGFALGLLGGNLVSGSAYVMQMLGIEQAIAWADWVVTGEGSSDSQTLQGKLPFHIAQEARKSGKKIALISGMIDNDAELAMYFDRLIPASGRGTPVNMAMQQAYTRLCAAASSLP